MDGEALRRRRRALKLNQTELGRLLGVRQNTISRWELGETMQHPRMLDLALEAIEKRKTWVDLLDAMSERASVPAAEEEG